jgi:hypothetical protein
MLMPNDYSRPADGRPTGAEIAFLASDVPASFAKARRPTQTLSNILSKIPLAYREES